MGINRSSLRNLMNRLLTVLRAKSFAVPEPLQAIWYLIAFETVSSTFLVPLTPNGFDIYSIGH